MSEKNLSIVPETGVADLGLFGKPLFQDPGARALRRVGVVDVGSNSVRMVVFDGAARSPAYFYNEKIMCALGAGIGAEFKSENVLECLFLPSAGGQLVMGSGHGCQTFVKLFDHALRVGCGRSGEPCHSLDGGDNIFDPMLKLCHQDILAVRCFQKRGLVGDGNQHLLNVFCAAMHGGDRDQDPPQ